jgi:spermidine/putrescine transport system substrate-binding protein
MVGATSPVLNVYSWSGYLPGGILRQFTQETGIRVNYSTYDSNEALYTKLKASPQSHRYDVIMPSSYTVHRMIQEKMLAPLDKERLSHLKYLDASLLNKAYDPNNTYSIPYLFSSTGIVVNSKYHDSSTLNRWQALWDTRFKGKLLLLDDMRELFSIALLALGYSPNTQDPDQIEKAYLKLRELLNNARVLSTESVASLYLDEDLTVGMGWNGDMYHVLPFNKDLKFMYPKEGYILSIDSLSIPQGAQHIDEAYTFINFLLRPDVAAKISRATGYAIANSKARAYLPKAMQSNPIMYPDKTTLERGIIQLSAGNQTPVYEKYWELLKIEG